MLNRAIIRTEVSATKFGIFTDDSKKGLSVVSIQTAETLDIERKPIDGGLYDPAMGPLDQNVFCKTCNMNFAGCPGHVGHVELDFPVYYPVYFNDLVRILRSKCVYCHRLRLSSLRVRVYLTKLKLLEMGDFSAAETILDVLNSKQLDLDAEVQAPTNNTYDEVIPTDAEEKLTYYEKKYDSYVRSRRHLQTAPDLYIKTMQRETIDAFMRTCIAAKKCETCGAFSPPFRKDGSTKIFQKPMPKRQEKAMAPLKLKYRSAIDALSSSHQAASSSSAAMDVSEDDSDEDLNGEAEETDGEESSDDTGDEARAPRDEAKEAQDKYLTSMEVEAQMQMLWRKSGEVMNFVWTRAMGMGLDIDLKTAESWRLFFTRVVVVPPNKFRPAAVVGDRVNEHPQNVHLRKIIEENAKLRLLQYQSADTLAAIENTGVHLSKVVTGLIALQASVNNFMDSSKAPAAADKKDASIGIRQLLERKEGLFRRNMMGKRVNYCCRSVISPDNNLGTNEIGIPVQFAKELHYPTPVNDYNIAHLRELVIRGPHQYPGANQIETADGKIIKLEKLSAGERVGKAKLLNKQGMKVYRHLIDGDALLVNRQPSLHKASIMAHKARVLTHVKEQTLRMHYANCSSYNADFDGDEMNCHFVQNELARAEAYTICNTDNQYIVPTSGNPIRGLIQDHVSSAVKLTCKNTFLTKAEFQQLLYIALNGLPGTEIVTAIETIRTPPPTVWKPQPLWTGKQVISALLQHLCRHPLPQVSLDSKARTPAVAFGAEHGEHEVVIRQGELLFGVLDKNAIGNASLGLVHAVYELYGAELAGRLLNSFARVFTFHLQNAGHSCGIEDLVLKDSSDAERRELLNKVDHSSREGLVKFLSEDASGTSAPSSSSSDKTLRGHLAKYLNGTRDRKDGKVKLDAAMQQVVNKSASDVIKACLPHGLRSSFLQNHFALMVMTGAKGSAVNQSQITCFLGQQALEGQRVPVMASGKTLPSFHAFDGSARAGGFVRDRFLTGVKPQEYYFHCMAGREGLVDTAVKTSRSGYLQRCLVKHLEELNVCYDHTVRDSASNVVQFLYGEDGVDTLQNALLAGKNNQLLFLARNHRALTYKFSLHAQFFAQGLEMDSATKHHDFVARAKQLERDTAALWAAGDLEGYTQRLAQKGNILLAKKRRDPDLNWNRSNLCEGWYAAEIVKVRSGESSSSSKKRPFPLVDLVYYEFPSSFKSSSSSTPSVSYERKVPLAVLVKPGLSAGGGPQFVQADALPLFLVKPGVPDPAMSALRLGNAVGACSERVQAAFREYVLQDPDRMLLTSTGSAAGKDPHAVSADAMELLLWVKFMRSLAAPGEAVGCVAAQSVGEPSTQMTLNTFHLAGHGGANVTLGIPRLREILMTASRTPKTPTMLIPCVPLTSKSAAQALARHLSRLTLAELLDHRGGIVVGEQIVRATAFSRWERKYRLRLQLLPLAALQAAFSVSCAEIVRIVETTFLAKLDHLLKIEQRRAGESTGGKNDPLKSFRGLAPGTTGDIEEGGRSKGGKAGNDDDQNDDEGDDLMNSAEFKAAARRGHLRRQEGEDSDADDADDDDDNDSVDSVNQQLTSDNKKSRVNKKAATDDEDEEEDEDEEADDLDDIFGSDDDEGDVSKAQKKKSGKKVTISEEDEDEIDRIVSGLKEFDDSANLEDEDEDNVQGKKKSSGSKSSRKSLKSGGLDGNSQRLVEHSEAENWVQVTLYLPVTSRRILLAQLAEKAAAITTIRATKNLLRAYLSTEDNASKKTGPNGTELFAVGTEGVNFAAIWALPDTLVDHNQLVSNDVYQILTTYGVEAARASIVGEIQAVFAVYGIDVNARHLSLIADFMTRNGGYNALNRIGMLQCASPFLQMSFETTCTFLTRAVQEGLHDNQQSPSARIVLGSAARVGTGAFDLLVPFSAAAEKAAK